jgi:hypothetical protein
MQRTTRRTWCAQCRVCPIARQRLAQPMIRRTGNTLTIRSVGVLVWPSPFAALRWTPEFAVGGPHVYPFAKGHVESGLAASARAAV